MVASKIQGVLGTADSLAWSGEKPSRVQQKVKLEKAHGNQILKGQLGDNEESRLYPREGISAGAENLIGYAWNGLGIRNQR